MKKFKIESTEQLLSLMNIYYSEWAHRDSLMWKQVFTFFFAVFVIILLPFAQIWNVTLAEEIPHFIFPITGIVLSFVFLYIGMQYAQRVSKISETYRDLIEYLPEEFQRKYIYKKKRMAYTIPAIMFLALIAFGTIILILCLKK